VEASIRSATRQRDARYFTVRPTEQDIPSPPTRSQEIYEDNRQSIPRRVSQPRHMSIETKDLLRNPSQRRRLASAYDAHKWDYFTPENAHDPADDIPTSMKPQGKDRLTKGEDFLPSQRARHDRGRCDPSRRTKTVFPTKLPSCLLAEKGRSAIRRGQARDIAFRSPITPERQASLDEVAIS